MPDKEIIPDDLAKEVYKLFKKSRDSEVRTKWLAELEKNFEFYENEQWDAAKKKEMEDAGLPVLTINHIMPTVRRKVGFMTDSRPEIKVLPIGKEDVIGADVIGQGVMKIWDDSQGSDVTFDVCVDSENAGLGWYDVDVDETNAILIGKRDSRTVFPDPRSRHKFFDDASYIIFSDTITKAEAEDEYDVDQGELSTEGESWIKEQGISGGPRRVDYQQKRSGDVDSDTEESMTRVIDAWIFEVVGKNFLAWEGDTNIKMLKEDSDEDLQALREELDKLSQEKGKKYDIIKRKIKQVRHILAVGGVLKTNEVNPLGYDCRFRPLIPAVCIPCIPKSDTALSAGLVSFLRSPQEELNKARSQAIYYISVATGSPWQAEQGQLVEGTDDFNKRASIPNTLILRQKGTPPLERSGPPAFPQGYFTREDRSKQDIEFISMVNEVLSGEPPGANASGKMVLALQEYATMSLKPSIRSEEAAIERLGRVVLAFMKKYWTAIDFMMMRADITQEQAIEIMNNLVNSRWDLKVTAGSTLPSNRIAKLEYALEMRKEGIYDAEAVLKYSDDPNADEVLSRMRQGEIGKLLNSPEGQKLLQPVIIQMARQMIAQQMAGGAGPGGVRPPV